MSIATEEESAVESCQRIPITHGQELELRQDSQGTLLRVKRANNTVVKMRITASGAELLLDERCAIRASGELHLEADRLSFEAREHLSLSSAGDADISIQGDLISRARIQELRSTLGNVNIKANDDVKVRAERICLNT